jgi:hypothetical protein
VRGSQDLVSEQRGLLLSEEDLMQLHEKSIDTAHAQLRRRCTHGRL